MRRFFRISLALVLATSAFSLGSSSQASETWTSSIGDGSINIVHNTKAFELVQWPDVWRSKKGSAGRKTKSLECVQLGTAPCTNEVLEAASQVYPLNPDKSISEAFANREWAIQGNVIFGACESASDFGCIEKLEIAASEGQSLEAAKFQDYLNPELHRTAQPEFNSVASRSNSVWRISNGTLFQITNRATQTFSRGLVNYSDFRLAIGEVGSESLKQPIRAKITIRVPKGLGGWFHGRLKDIGIDYSAGPSGYSRLIVEGNSVDVPEVSWAVDSGKLSDAAKKTIGMSFVPEQYNWSNSWVDKRVKVSQIVAPLVANKASTLNTVWAFGQNSGWWGPTRCFFDVDPVTGETTEFAKATVLGFVTSNAMIYDYYPASFSKGTMDFQVAGLHFLPDGSLTRGNYEMIMSADAARCFYHYTKAPLSASISVVNENGNAVVSTRTVSQSGGFLKVRAHNFTFSAPKVRVKISGKLQPKSTLICTKGKTVKRVVDWEPTCPKGFAPKK